MFFPLHGIGSLLHVQGVVGALTDILAGGHVHNALFEVIQLLERFLPFGKDQFLEPAQFLG